MRPADAIAILEAVFARPVENTAATPPLHARLSFAPAPDGEKATARLSVFAGDEWLYEKEQELLVVPARAELEIDERRYRAFAEGARAATRAADLEVVMPDRLLLVNLLRLPGLQTPQDFARAIHDGARARRLLAPLEVDDYRRARRLPPITDAATQLALHTLMGDASVEEAERAARQLTDEGRLDAIPHLLCILEDWQARMSRTGGLSWISEDDRNVDVVLARILEPLLRMADSEREVKQLQGLEVMGMFDEEHETLLVEWMYET